MKKTALIRINLILHVLRAILRTRQSGLDGSAGQIIVILKPGARNQKPRILIIKNQRDLELRSVQDHFFGSDGRPFIKPHREASLKDPLLNKIDTMLDSHMDDPRFGVEELCRDLGMSRAQIYRKFSALNERTLHDYLRFYRLRRARELLLTTDLNVSEAACVTGFSNLSHFSRIFCEEFGQHPKDYRKKMVFST